MKAKTLLESANSGLIYYPEVFTEWDYQKLIDAVPWRQNTLRMFGKEVAEPRLTCWYGPAYTYSSVKWEERAFPALLTPLMKAVQEIAKQPYNAVLLNLYRDGNDAMGWHRDNEPEIDQRSIASVSFGAERSFKVRHRDSKETTDIVLENGSLLLMENLQEHYEHSLPKRKKIDSERLNLTFRIVRT